jgi:hypothetical protein
MGVCMDSARTVAAKRKVFAQFDAYEYLAAAAARSAVRHGVVVPFELSRFLLRPRSRERRSKRPWSILTSADQCNIRVESVMWQLGFSPCCFATIYHLVPNGEVVGGV